MTYHYVQHLSLIAFMLILFTANAQHANTPPGTQEEHSLVLPITIHSSIEPYTSIEEALANELVIDWYRDKNKAQAIRTAYAIAEYQYHLKQANISTSFQTLQESTEGNALYLLLLDDPDSHAILKQHHLNINNHDLGQQGFMIIPHEFSIFILAHTSTGILYGTYRFLEQLGFRWFDPYNTVIPELTSDTTLERTSVIEKPALTYRGFWTYGDLSDDDEGDIVVPEAFLVWMARNRLNIAGAIPSPLNHKLGIHQWAGGHHLIKHSLDSDELFKAHPEWYGEINGRRQAILATNSSANYRNPSFANRDMALFIAEQLLERLTTGDMRHVDIVNLWPADSRSPHLWDQSELAQAHGNHTDNLLYFYLVIAQYLSEAYKAGEINRLVSIAGISYYVTWEPPTNVSTVTALAELDNYLHIFYTNQRNFSQSITDNLTDNDMNAAIVNQLQAWHNQASLSYGVVEYYNYSIFSAISLTDMEFFADNFHFFTRQGPSLFAYMHPTVRNAGPRRLTNYLLSHLPWVQEPSSQAEELIDDYFTTMFTDYSDDWREVYTTMSQASSNTTQLMRYCRTAMFADYFWAINPLTDTELITILERCQQGGVQELLDLPYKQAFRSSFIGLETSLELLLAAEQQWHRVLDNQLPETVLQRMLEDITWFEATHSRYRLLHLAFNFQLLKRQHADDETLKRLAAEIKNEVGFLLTTDVTQDTMSPVNQREAIYNPYKAMYEGVE